MLRKDLPIRTNLSDSEIVAVSGSSIFSTNPITSTVRTNLGDIDRLVVSPPSLSAIFNQMAISTRRIVPNYSGNCLTVRRSSDNTTQNIGFSGSDLNTSALLSFVGSGDGFVTQIFDQLGVATITQAIAASQPKIVTSGSLVTMNSIPSMLFDGSNDFFDVSGVNLSDNYSIDINFAPTNTITTSSPYQPLIYSSPLSGTLSEGGIGLGGLTGSVTGETLYYFSYVVSPSFRIPVRYSTQNLSGTQQVKFIVNNTTGIVVANNNGGNMPLTSFEVVSNTNKIPDISFVGADGYGRYFNGKISDLWVTNLLI